MNQNRTEAILQALLRPFGFVEPQLGGSGQAPVEASAALAREFLASRPVTAGLADPVAQGIAAQGIAPLIRLGLTAELLASGPASAENGRPAIREELERIPDGPSAAFLAALSEVVLLQLADCPVDTPDLGPLVSWADVTRLDAAVCGALAQAGGDADGVLLLEGQWTGLDALLFGSAENRLSPGDLPALAGRAFRIVGYQGGVARRLYESVDADRLSLVESGLGRFLLLLPDTPDARARLLDERAAIERELLARFEGESSLDLALTPARIADLGAGSDLRGRLATSLDQRTAVPFCDALAAENALGPFGDRLLDADQLDAEAVPDRALGGQLHGGRFALEEERWPPRMQPIHDADELARKVGEAGGGEIRVEWPGNRDGLRVALEVSARCGGRIRLEPSPILPVQSDLAHREGGESIAAVRCEVRRHSAGGPNGAPFLVGMACSRAQDDLTRLAAAGLAQGRSVTILAGGGNHVLAVGPVRAIALFVDRLAGRVRELLPEDRFGLDATIAASGVARHEAAVADLSRLVRDALVPERSAPTARPDQAERGITTLFGARVATDRLAELIHMGDDLVELAETEPGTVAALLKAALRVGTGGEGIPLSEVARLRARIHELVARLGVSAVPSGTAPAGDPDRSTRALRGLIDNFGRMFDSGAARIPLSYAVLLSQSPVREKTP